VHYFNRILTKHKYYVNIILIMASPGISTPEGPTPSPDSPLRITVGPPEATIPGRLRVNGEEVTHRPQLRGKLLVQAATDGALAEVESEVKPPIERDPSYRPVTMETFTALRPDKDTVQIYSHENVDIRLASNAGEDGVAYNPETEALVVCDGMGGVGPKGDIKHYFAFALAHATAELENIAEVLSPEGAERVVERAKAIMEQQLHIPVEHIASGLKSSMGEASQQLAWGATLVAIQKRPDTRNSYRVVTIGDSSVTEVDEHGRVNDGRHFGEAAQGDIDEKGLAEDGALGTFIGMSNDHPLKGHVQKMGGKVRRWAVSTLVSLAPDRSLVATTDFYFQKTTPEVFEEHVQMTPEAWKKAMEGMSRPDDATMAIMRQPR